jgi:hypothetical protein
VGLHLSTVPFHVEGHPFHVMNNVNGSGSSRSWIYQVLPLDPRVQERHGESSNNWLASCGFWLKLSPKLFSQRKIGFGLGESAEAFGGGGRESNPPKTWRPSTDFEDRSHTVELSRFCPDASAFPQVGQLWVPGPS